MAKVEKGPIDQAWKNWSDCLNGDDVNSIFQQISTMIWDTAIFHIIIEARKSQIKKNPQNPTINGALHSFIDRNYFLSQCGYIRRLTETSYGLTGEKGIYSIGAIIKDIINNYQNELTREMYLKLRNMPYDYTEIRNKEMAFALQQPLGKAFFIPSELDWEPIEEAHQIFDLLSHTNINKRSPDDLIDIKIFDRLLAKLSSCKEITNYVHKFIAHSAIPESRSDYEDDFSIITFNRLWEAQQIIFKVAHFLSVILFAEGHLALAIENSTFFEFWEAPLFEKGEIDNVRISLESYRKETDIWGSEEIEDILNWIGDQ